MKIRQQKTRTGGQEIFMSELNQEQEVAILPAGSEVRIMGCRVVILEDVQVEGDQQSLDFILKAQEDFKKGIDIVGQAPATRDWRL